MDREAWDILLSPEIWIPIGLLIGFAIILAVMNKGKK